MNRKDVSLLLREWKVFLTEDVDRLRGGIYWRGELVGFMTPREEKGGWRVGAIYVDSEVRERVKGIGSIAISKFFEGREAADLLIGVDNVSSQRAFANAGFTDTGKEYVDDSDGWKATVWSRASPESRRLYMF